MFSSKKKWPNIFLINTSSKYFHLKCVVKYFCHKYLVKHIRPKYFVKYLRLKCVVEIFPSEVCCHKYFRKNGNIKILKLITDYAKLDPESRNLFLFLSGPKQKKELKKTVEAVLVTRYRSFDCTPPQGRLWGVWSGPGISPNLENDYPRLDRLYSEWSSEN